MRLGPALAGIVGSLALVFTARRIAGGGAALVSGRRARLHAAGHGGTRARHAGRPAARGLRDRPVGRDPGGGTRARLDVRDRLVVRRGARHGRGNAVEVHGRAAAGGRGARLRDRPATAAPAVQLRAVDRGRARSGGVLAGHHVERPARLALVRLPGPPRARGEGRRARRAVDPVQRSAERSGAARRAVGARVSDPVPAHRASPCCWRWAKRSPAAETSGARCSPGWRSRPTAYSRSARSSGRWRRTGPLPPTWPAWSSSRRSPGPRSAGAGSAAASRSVD